MCIVFSDIVHVGIQYLREYLNLPQEIVPATLKRPVRTEGARPRPKGMCGERLSEQGEKCVSVCVCVCVCV